jgi:hypothetical protein
MNELEDFYISHKKIVELALYKIRNEKYTTKSITKKNGGTRVLNIPPIFTRVVQTKFNDILQKQYKTLKPVHGFVKSENTTPKSIVSNASQHVRKRYVINVDIEDFFGSINFGRVRGLFLSKPFNTSESIATKLAQLTTYEDKLPQGSPSSPIISNLICKKLDHELIKVAKEFSLTYTRYADDITFSTYKKKINSKRIIRTIDKVVKNNGFSINKEKTRVQDLNHTQIVTGLKVNQKVNLRRKYIKQIRSMLFSWYKDGLEKASDLHFDKFNKQESKYINDREESFKNILIGKINFLGQVKGKDDRLFIKFTHTFYLLRDNYSLSSKQGKFEMLNINNLTYTEVIKVFTQIYDTKLVLTEGITDITYLKSALKYFQDKGQFEELKLRYCYLDSISSLIEVYKALFEEKKIDIVVANRRKCILPHVDNNIKLCFVMDSDDKKVNVLKSASHFKNYYLLAEDIKGYIEKMFEKDFVIKIIEEHGYEINTSSPELQPSSKKGLEDYLNSSKKTDGEIHSVSSTSYIANGTKIIKKTDLSHYIVKSEDANYDKFEGLFQHLETINHININENKLCSTSIY